MTAETAGSLTEGQEQALASLRFLVRISDGALTEDLGYARMDGVMVVRVWLSAASLLSSEQGTQLEDWEPIDIQVYDDFPCSSPIASTGRDDFPALPHQPIGSGFCVRVEDSAWNPAADMSGFMQAVIDAYQQIALDALEGKLQAWRPHVYYHGTGCAVIKADPPVTTSTQNDLALQWAVGVQIDSERIDITGWQEPHGDLGSPADGDDDSISSLADGLVRELEPILSKSPNAFMLPAVILTEPVALEYLGSWYGLLSTLELQGVDRQRLSANVALATSINNLHNKPQPDEPERAALAFRVRSDTQTIITDDDSRFAVARLGRDDCRLLSAVSAIPNDEDLPDELVEKLLVTAVPWVRVYDGRPESAQRRAVGRPTDKLARSKVLLLGCGALGAPIAEHCIRAGAARVHIVDSGTVSPGVLSRQPYEDLDIGKSKAKALANRLSRIRPEAEITARVADIVSSDIFSASDLGQYDLIVDATANRSVATKVERLRRDERKSWPALITVAINEQATHGVAALTPPGAVGAGVDLLRQLGLRTFGVPALRDVYEAFFPPKAGRLGFRPDNGCSDTTFIGSTTDIAALAAQLLDSALAHLDLPGTTEAGTPHSSLNIVRLGRHSEPAVARVALDVPPDRVVTDHGQAYEIRLDETAIAAMRWHISKSVKGETAGDGHTGGLLLGQFDSACRIAWISQATSLPPGSTAESLEIKLDVQKVRNYLDDYRSRSGGILTLIGFWHTHPTGPVTPSDEDLATMQKLADDPEWRSAQALLLVIGKADEESNDEPPLPWAPEMHAEIFTT